MLRTRAHMRGDPSWIIIHIIETSGKEDASTYDTRGAGAPPQGFSPCRSATAYRSDKKLSYEPKAQRKDIYQS